MNHTDPTETARTLRDRIAEALYESGLTEGEVVAPMTDAVLAVLPPPTDRAAVTPPPALTEEGRLRAQVEMLTQDNERDRGLAKVGARCMRDGHQGLIEQGRGVLEGWRFAFSVALDLGTGAPWEAILERAKELRRLAAETQQTQTETRDAPPADIQVWPLQRILTEVRCGSRDWTWDEEWADLDRRHAATGYLDKLEQQIRENGITMPVLIGSDGRLWDGHHRLRIAVRAGIGYVPVEIVPAAAPVVPVEAAADDEETTS